MTSLARVLLVAAVVTVCSARSAAGESSVRNSPNAIEAFPDREEMGSVVGQVVAPQTGDLSAQSLPAATTPAQPSSLRGSSSSHASEDTHATTTISSAELGSSEDRTILPGQNGFGQVSYNDSTRAQQDTASRSSAKEDQAAHILRLRKAEREAKAKNPNLRLKLRIAI